MRIECIHGYFKFFETAAGQISRFTSLYGLELERSGDHFTFSDLVDAPTYSLLGGTFLGMPTIATFSGDPWEVMEENRLVYDFSVGIVRPLDSIVQLALIKQTGHSFVTSGMLLPGSLTDAGKRVKDYSAHWIQDRENFKYSEIRLGI